MAQKLAATGQYFGNQRPYRNSLLPFSFLDRTDKNIFPSINDTRYSNGVNHWHLLLL